MLFTIEPICNCEMIPNHVTCYLKNPGCSPGVLCSNHTKPICSLFVVCFHLFQPITVSIGADIRGGERKSRLESPFFQRFHGYHLRVSHLAFAWLLPVIDQI